MNNYFLQALIKYYINIQLTNTHLLNEITYNYLLSNIAHKKIKQK